MHQIPIKAHGYKRVQDRMKSLTDGIVTSVELGWDKIVLGLIGVVAAMGTTLGLVIKKLLGPNRERDRERNALVDHLRGQADKADRHHEEILAQQDRHHSEREASRRESMEQMAQVMEARHAEVMQAIETLRADITRLVATVLEKVTAAHDTATRSAAKDSDWRHFLNTTLLKIASTVATEKAKTPEDVLRILQGMLEVRDSTLPAGPIPLSTRGARE